MSGGSLRRELRLLESIFDQTHERLRIISARVDELTCEFITEAGGTVRVHCNITESYPNVPPIWFVDSDDPSLASVLERLADIKKGNTLFNEICSLCGFTSLNWFISHSHMSWKKTCKPPNNKHGSLSD
uniref:Uncharacterized protein n=1 Tax=Erpetoichthys calabaricus TaxID=27687 RepID=A0A8C4RUL7_ERPCA